MHKMSLFALSALALSSIVATSAAAFPGTIVNDDEQAAACALAHVEPINGGNSNAVVATWDHLSKQEAKEARRTCIGDQEGDTNDADDDR